MKNKYIYNFIALVLSVMILSACSEEDGRVEFEGPYYVEMNDAAASASESNTDPINIRVNNVGTTLGQDIVVTYSFEGSTAIEGRDFEILGSDVEGEIIIPAGKNTGSITIRPIPNLAVDGNLVYNVKLTSNNANLAIGRGELGLSYSLTIIDDDCPIDLAADYAGEWEVTDFCAAPGSFNEGFCVSSTSWVGTFVTLAADASDPLGFTAILSGGIHDEDMILNFQTCPGTVSIDATYALSFSQNGAPAAIGPTDEPAVYGTGTFSPESKIIRVVGSYGNVDIGLVFDEFIIEYTKK